MFTTLYKLNLRFVTVEVVKMSKKVSLQYSSIKDLQQKTRINYTGKKPSDIYKRLPDMYNLAENAKLQGEEEKQYIMLKRWMNCIDWLKTTREYRDDRTFLNMHIKQVGSGYALLNLSFTNKGIPNVKFLGVIC